MILIRYERLLSPAERGRLLTNVIGSGEFVSLIGSYNDPPIRSLLLTILSAPQLHVRAIIFSSPFVLSNSDASEHNLVFLFFERKNRATPRHTMTTKGIFI